MVALLYGPYLWLDCATLNVISGAVADSDIVFVIEDCGVFALPRATSTPSTDDELFKPPVEFWSATWAEELGEELNTTLPSTVSPGENTPEVIWISNNFGTIYSFTSSPSKKPYNLVNGFILFEVNSIFLDLRYGIIWVLTKDVPPLLVSKVSLVIFLVPVRVLVPFWVLLTVSVLISSLPTQAVSLSTVSSSPVQVVCQESQISGPYPDLGSFPLASNWVTVSVTLPWSSIVFEPMLEVSHQTSDDGINSTVPA